MMSIQASAIDPRAVETSVRAPGYGGVVTFVGVVRDADERGVAVAALEYEAHESLALAEFEKIAAEAIASFGDVRIAIAHRAGRVVRGEVAVVVSAAAIHRGAASSACRFAIDALKLRAPIWKREVYEDGDAVWKDNCTHA